MKGALLIVVFCVLVPCVFPARVDQLGTPSWPGPATCSNTSSMIKAEQKLNNDTLYRVLSEMHTKQDFGAVEFFNTFFLVPFENAYKQDVANLIAFQSIMSESDPAPSENPFGLIFKIFLKLIEVLPDVGSEIAFAIDLINDGIQLATDSGSNSTMGSISWKSFIATKALSYPDASEGLNNGLWAYIKAFWKKHKLPSTIKSKNTGERELLQGLLRSAFKNQITQTQAFIHLAADYVLHIKGGVVARIPFNDHKEYFWRISQLHSNMALTNELLKMTDNCIDPKTNFKGSDGRQVPIYISWYPSGWLQQCQKYHTPEFGMNHGATDDIAMCGGVPGKDIIF